MSHQLFFNTILLIVVTCFVILQICNGTELNSNENEAKKIALETSDEMFKFFDNWRDEHFNPMDIVRQAKKFDFMNFKDKELKYAFEEITIIADEEIIGGERYLEILDSLDELEDLEFNRYYDCFKGCGTNATDILGRYIPKVISTSKNPEEIEFYWKQLAETRADWANKNLNLMLNGLKDAAKLTGKSPLDFWLQDYNLTLLDSLMIEIKPLYRELHAFIRQGLQKKYGDSIIESDGLIPHHLFEQVMAQAWTNGSIIEEMFPHKNLPPVESVLEKRFKTIELFEIADRFYQNLGFTEFPYQVWKDHIQMWNSSDEDSEQCYTSDLYYSSPNIHLDFCKKMNFAMFLEAYSDMGKLYYAKEMTGLPAYFFFTHDLVYSIGKAAILSASTHHNLEAIGMILEFNFTEEVEMNRLLRKSIQSLLDVAVNYVHIKLMEELMSGNVDASELNNKYWELMNKYVGVEQPMNYQKRPEFLDLPFSFYFDMNENAQSRNFESEILSYQLYKKFCELGGKYPKEPLHLCDIHGTKAAGEVLKNMMRLGISKPYTEVLARMFPENPRISAECILDYYSPVKRFLVEKNSDANVNSGWKHSPENSS